jgi:hypothetical protein
MNQHMGWRSSSSNSSEAPEVERPYFQLKHFDTIEEGDEYWSDTAMKWIETSCAGDKTSGTQFGRTYRRLRNDFFNF